jgi:hypothetical protein
MILRKVVRLLVLLPLVSLAYPQTAASHLFFRVTLDPSQQPASGRLLIFLTAGSGAKSVEVNQFKPSAVSIAAKELSELKPGESIDVDVDDLAFPAPFSALAPGTYQAQAVLDVGHT